MTDPTDYPRADPRRHTAAMRERLSADLEYLRTEIGEIEDPRGEALLETSREVIGGLVTAFEHFEQRSEEAWRK